MKYEKLVRDKIPERLDSKGITYKKRIATDNEYVVELVKKLQEETQEFVVDFSVEELADVCEVLDALKQLPQFKDVASVQKQKRDERGGFEKKIILKGEQ